MDVSEREARYSVSSNSGGEKNNGWKVMDCIRLLHHEINKDDSAGRFAKAVHAGQVQTRRTLRQMGVYDTELKMWVEEGLIDKQGKERYVFTDKAVVVVERIEAAERFANEFADELRSLID